MGVEDKLSMLNCLKRYFPKHSDDILRYFLEMNDCHLYSSISKLLSWQIQGCPKIFQGSQIHDAPTVTKSNSYEMDHEHEPTVRVKKEIQFLQVLNMLK